MSAGTRRASSEEAVNRAAAGAGVHGARGDEAAHGAALDGIARIDLPQRLRDALVVHARRKLSGRWLAGETHEHQAFGLLAGRLVGEAIETTSVFPLMRNMRADPVHGAWVDHAVNQMATPSKTPLAQRGWLADPAELLRIHVQCDTQGELVYGSYHMHKTSWSHDPLRDTPTALDTALAAEQGIWMLILSMVDPERPRLRAFFEGREDREAPIRLVADPR